MELRHISLRADFGTYDDIFFITFFDNANFISNFVSKRIRSYHIKTDGTYNAIAINITTNNSSCKIVPVNTLDVKIQFTMEEKKQYLRTGTVIASHRWIHAIYNGSAPCA